MDFRAGFLCGLCRFSVPVSRTGHYDGYCYLPLYVFCGRHLLAAKLRRANIDASAGAADEIAAEMAAARADSEASGKPARWFRDFTWSTLDSWSRARRVIGKAGVG